MVEEAEAAVVVVVEVVAARVEAVVEEEKVEVTAAADGRAPQVIRLAAGARTPRPEASRLLSYDVAA